MKELSGMLHLIKLKEIYRLLDIESRKESTAEHTWSCIILALHFLKRIKEKLDESRVIKLLLYHDLVEIEAGDTSILERVEKEKKERELKAFEILKTKMPSNLVEEYSEYFNEFEEGKTRESKFAHAIDKLEPMLHFSMHKEDWTKEGFTEEIIRKHKDKHMQEFPEINKFYEEFIEHLKKNNNI